MERRETSGNQPGHVGDDFNLLSQDFFINESNFVQFIDLIRGETNDPIAKFCLNYDCEHINGCLDHTQFRPTPGDQDQDQDPLFGCNNLSSGLNALPAVDVGEEENDDDIGEEYSSATTTTTTRLTKRKGGDRSRTLVSERKGRGRKKEKLYALRALVPNIIKMDKASIVGDAVEYLQELQMQARKLRAEIAGHESSLTEGDKHQQGIVENRKNIQFICPNHPICKNIMQVIHFILYSFLTMPNMLETFF
ncbi:Transcription factor FER-LIKE IRON DEFICIENCY-INDUCED TRANSCRIPTION FACTOR [Camellia lanceoleosa]|uniref:Transcription factor FER-LIKE IRON DEFICIENCY-INDUCED TRANSCRIPTION FACTOR n=1 Tax=Camellia lanceoleosa TaxID=1840588 RepID=A0ACC0F7N9_9ERIC|nr:Transcription factor FER-LIKE IRON DEFICIENCY-INDUCED TRANSCRIPTION FACTOR [Camellia lanceoleosa]